MISQTVFRSETDYFTAINCDDFYDLYKAPYMIFNYNGFIFASDLEKYTACYYRPSIGYTTSLTNAGSTLVSSMPNPWGAPGVTSDFSLSGTTSSAVLNLVLSQIYYN